MKRAIEETTRRRAIQEAYNIEHGIEPASIVKDVDSPLVRMSNLDYYEIPLKTSKTDLPDAESLRRKISELEKQMKGAAKELDFEKAAALRDEIRGSTGAGDFPELGGRWRRGERQPHRSEPASGAVVGGATSPLTTDTAA